LSEKHKPGKKSVAEYGDFLKKTSKMAFKSFKKFGTKIFI
jgi:hypothetical protein